MTKALPYLASLPLPKKKSFVTLTLGLSFNLEHSTQKVFFLKYRIKGFASDEISLQVSSSLQGQG
jgi:hypothetical protein